MKHTKTYNSIYPKNIILALFMLAFVLLAGKIIHSQFTNISLTFAHDVPAAEKASMMAPEFFHQNVIETGKLTGNALALYRSEVSRKDVVWFYSHITGDERIAKIILENASKNNIDPPLAFALAWVESRYQIRAVNKNAASIDRGLFQLNNKAFPKLTEKDFFDPEKNAHFGLTHLSYCIDLSGNEIAALAMYNAGTTKVRNDNTPKRTLDYISYILSYRNGLENLFHDQVEIRYSVDNHDRVTLLK